MPDVPTITLTFAVNKSFQAVNPIIPINDKQVRHLCWVTEKKAPNQLLALIQALDEDSCLVNLTCPLALSQYI
jgi:hypothetical protein